MKQLQRTSPFHQGLLALIILILGLTSCTGTTTPSVNVPSATLEPSIEPSATKNAANPVTATPEVLPSEPTPDPLIDDPENLEGETVRLLHAWAGPTASTLADVAREFSLTNPWGIWVEVEAFGSEDLLLGALQSDLEAGTPPSLVAVHPALLNNLESTYATANLSAYFEDQTWGYTPEEQADWQPLFLESMIKDGDLTGLPIAPSASVLFYNQSWGEELGFSEPPRTQDSFREVNCEATNFNLNNVSEDDDGTGGWLMNFDPIVLLSWYHAHGGAWEEDQMPLFNNETGIAAFGGLKALYDQGCIWIGRRSEPYQYFADRIALMYAGTLDQIPTQKGWMELSENNDNWSVVGFPGPEEETMLMDGPSLYITESSSEAQLAAWLFAKHLLNPKTEASLIESAFTIPVRKSTMGYLDEFAGTYPQWAQGVALLEKAGLAPKSDEWEIGQWVLQDAIYQSMLREADQLPGILEELDVMIEEVTGD